MGGRKKKPAKWVWRKKEQSTASSSAPPPPLPPWVELPRDITANILQRLDAVEILKTAQRVCSTWRSVCKDPSMWRKIDFCSGTEIMFKKAVDRSQGQLLDLRIYSCGSDSLLRYVAKRSSQLRCLTLAFCNFMTGKAIVKAVKRFPLLEELHLSFMFTAGEFVGKLGHSCPKLKSFSINKPGSRIVAISDIEALAIAKGMSDLRHLSLIGNQMSNQGLIAILDGCTRLETLDLRLCFGVDLSGDLGKRCSQQLKSLKQPNEHAEEYGCDDDSCDGFSDWLDYGSQMSDYDDDFDFGYNGDFSAYGFSPSRWDVYDFSFEERMQWGLWG